MHAELDKLHSPLPKKMSHYNVLPVTLHVCHNSRTKPSLEPVRVLTIKGRL